MNVEYCFRSFSLYICLQSSAFPVTLIYMMYNSSYLACLFLDKAFSDDIKFEDFVPFALWQWQGLVVLQTHLVFKFVKFIYHFKWLTQGSAISIVLSSGANAMQLPND